MGRGGKPTAWGRILSRWEKESRECFLVEAWNRRNSDTYLVVFASDGTFITAYSTTRTDVVAPVYPMAPRRALRLLRLNDEVPEGPRRLITEDAILRAVTKSPVRLARVRDRIFRVDIPQAESLSLIYREGQDVLFRHASAETSRLIKLLCPAIGAVAQSSPLPA
jgi:hypothetical protein